jgi:Uncharacterized protein conserved in bacteria (DUF2087).
MAPGRGTGRGGTRRDLIETRNDWRASGCGPGERNEPVEMVAHRILKAGETLTGGQVNERLVVFTDDVAPLRRRLVDVGIVARTRSGSS